MPWARARARAPLDENGLGYGNRATSAALNQAVTSSSVTRPVNVATSSNPAAQRCQEALLADHPWVLTTCHHEVNRRARVAGGGEDGLDALVRRDEPEAQHGEAVVESQSAPGIAGGERRDVLDAVGDHRRRRHDLAKGGLVNDGRRACPCDGGLHGGDPDAGDRGWNADAMKVGVLAVDRCRIDDLMHRGDE